MRWTKIEEVYGATLKSLSIFNQGTEAGKKCYEDLHKRVIEHVIVNPDLEHSSYCKVLSPNFP
jgi:hypothetical protein